MKYCGVQRVAEHADRPRHEVRVLVGVVDVRQAVRRRPTGAGRARRATSRRARAASAVSSAHRRRSSRLSDHAPPAGRRRLDERRVGVVAPGVLEDREAADDTSATPARGLARSSRSARGITRSAGASRIQRASGTSLWLGSVSGPQRRPCLHRGSTRARARGRRARRRGRSARSRSAAGRGACAVKTTPNSDQRRRADHPQRCAARPRREHREAAERPPPAKISSASAATTR